MASAFRTMKNHIDDSLEKVRSKSWAKPLGQTLAISGKIVKGMGDFIPGATILGGALSFGSSLLNSEPSMKDLQRELKDIKISLEEGSQSKGIIRALQREQKELQEKISKPQGEINSNFKEVKMELHSIFTKVGETNQLVNEEISKLKDIIGKTYDLVADTRYRDGIEKVDAAYEVFLQDGFEDFQHFSFELKTIATMNLAPKRIEEYLTIIHERGGITMCQSVMEYVVVILGKYLQMMVAYSIFKEDQERVTLQFKLFNQHFTELGDVFFKVTTHAFKPGQKVHFLSSKRPTAEVKPIPRGGVLEVSESASDEVNAFLRKNGLSELKDIFSGSGVTLEDVLDMDDQEMKEIGIKAYKTRRALLKAIREHQLNQTEVPSRDFPTNVMEHQPYQPSRSEVTSRTLPTNVREYENQTGDVPDSNQPSQSKVPARAAPTTTPPPTSSLNPNRKHPDIKLSPNKLQAYTQENPEAVPFCVQGTHDIQYSSQTNQYYFEMEVISGGSGDYVYIGLAPDDCDLSQAPGWKKGTYGYHGDDGRIFNSRSYAKMFGPTYSTGDTVGCGINLKTGVGFYTKNGKYLGQAFKVLNFQKKMYPTFGFRSLGAKIKVNLENKPFLFGKLMNDDSGDVENVKGTKTFPDGRVYSGDLRNGEPHGNGRLTCPDGSEYVGHFKDCLFNGHGTEIPSNGIKYVGNFTDDLYNGQGTMTWPDGAKFVGNFTDDLFNAHGTVTLADGTKYSGMWKDGKKQ